MEFHNDSMPLLRNWIRQYTTKLSKTLLERIVLNWNYDFIMTFSAILMNSVFFLEIEEKQAPLTVTNLNTVPTGVFT